MSRRSQAAFDSPRGHSCPTNRRAPLVLWVAALACLLLDVGCKPPAPNLLLATTTSVGNSGLLDLLTTRYQEDADTTIRTQLVGSGLALRMLGESLVHAVMSHAPAAETTALAAHPGWRYRKVMWNAFVIVGPPSDPAQVSGTRDLADAMRRIASSNVTFLSRGDSSGTHEREEQLWARAGTRPQPRRLVVAGAGMGTTLQAASRTGAYTLTDRATFAQLTSKLDLRIVFEGDPQLLNTYAVVYDPAGPRGEAASQFAAWLSDGRGRDVIAGFTVGNGVAAFTVWPLDRPREKPGDVPY